MEILMAIERSARAALQRLDDMLRVIDRSGITAPVQDLSDALSAMAAHMRAAGTPVKAAYRAAAASTASRWPPTRS